MAYADPEKRKEYERRRKELVRSSPDLLARRRASQAAYKERKKDDPDVRKRAVQRTRRWQAKNPEKTLLLRRRANLKKYGITPEQYDEMYDAQGGACAICGAVCLRAGEGGEGKHAKVLAVDHDHTTGAVRKLLCSFCNRMIGLAKDDTRILQMAAAYLQEHAACEAAKGKRE